MGTNLVTHIHEKSKQTGTDANNGWQMIGAVEKLSHDRNYWSLIKARLPSINILGKEAEMGKSYLTPNLTLTQGRYI